jgi:hypothetical protein
LGSAICQAYAQAHYRQSEYDRSKHARRGRARGDELPLRNDQTGRTDAGDFPAHRYMQQLTGLEEVKFDLRKFNWIGTMEKTEVMFYVRADAPYKSFDDVVKSSEPLKCGATGSTDGTYLLAKIFEETLKTKFNLVVGYQSGNAIDLAMEKGEVICRGALCACGRELIP